MKNLKNISLKNLIMIRDNNYMANTYPNKKYIKQDIDFEIDVKTIGVTAKREMCERIKIKKWNNMGVV